MPKAYVIARANVTNAAVWAEYAAKASEAIKQYGGNPLVRGGRIEVAEGEGRARNVVIEFASFDAARAYAHSPSMRPRASCARVPGPSTSWSSKARLEASRRLQGAIGNAKRANRITLQGTEPKGSDKKGSVLPSQRTEPVSTTRAFVLSPTRTKALFSLGRRLVIRRRPRRRLSGPGSAEPGMHCGLGPGSFAPLGRDDK